MEARCFTVGPLQENCWFLRAEGATELLVVDPGEEAERLLGAVEELGATVAAILLTHTHFDHIGAVAAMARATGAPVYCPLDEVENMREPTAFPGYGAFEGWEPEETIAGGEQLHLAGLTIDVLSTPGHSPGHVTYHFADEDVIASGDVLFQDSIGRFDLPGSDEATLMRSLQRLLELPDETVVLPGHMGATKIGRERASNPFLLQLAQK
jgi:hydroxyacylglutathione hydrolase